MKNIIILLATVLFVLISSANAEIPADGIAFNDGKDILYYNRQSKEIKNLTQFDSTMGINGPFAVSEDGRKLIFAWENKILFANILSGGPKALKYGKRAETTIVSVKVTTSLTDNPTDSIIASPVAILAISPDGQFFAYDLIGRGQPWILGHFPVPNEICRAVNVLSVDYVNGMGPLFLDPYCNTKYFGAYATTGTCHNGMLGNIGYRSFASREEMFLHFLGNIQGGLNPNGGGHAWFAMNPVYKMQQLYLTWEQGAERFNSRRDACFPVFSKKEQWGDEQLLAVIYKTPAGFGTIEICDWSGARFRDTEKPGLYVLKLPFPLERCEGLTWTPEGSLMILSGGKVGIIDGKKIRDLISAGKTTLHDTYRGGRLASDNVLAVEPRIVADNPKIASNISGVSDDSFFYLDPAGNVCFQEKGKEPGKEPILLFQIPPQANQAFFPVNPPKVSPDSRVPGTFRLINNYVLHSSNLRRGCGNTAATKDRADGLRESYVRVLPLLFKIQHKDLRKTDSVTIKVEWNKNMSRKYEGPLLVTQPGGLVTDLIKHPDKVLYEEAKELPLTRTVKLGDFIAFKSGDIYFAIKINRCFNELTADITLRKKI